MEGRQAFGVLDICTLRKANFGSYNYCNWCKEFRSRKAAILTGSYAVLYAILYSTIRFRQCQRRAPIVWQKVWKTGRQLNWSKTLQINVKNRFRGALLYVENPSRRRNCFQLTASTVCLSTGHGWNGERVHQSRRRIEYESLYAIK